MASASRNLMSIPPSFMSGVPCGCWVRTSCRGVWSKLRDEGDDEDSDDELFTVTQKPVHPLPATLTHTVLHCHSEAGAPPLPASLTQSHKLTSSRPYICTRARSLLSSLSHTHPRTQARCKCSHSLTRLHMIGACCCLHALHIHRRRKPCNRHT